jgi:DNA-binding NtrC family response regulator
VSKNFQRQFIENSPSMRGLMELVGMVAPKDVRILICGETGTGKELIAEAIHSLAHQFSPFFAIYFTIPKVAWLHLYCPPTVLQAWNMRGKYEI